MSSTSQESNSPQDILQFKISNFNRVAATAGGFLSVFGLVSYLFKEKFYLGEALVSTVAGVIFSPHATNLIRPLEYANGDEVTLESITLYFSRLVLGVQLVIAGIQLPRKYLQVEWKSLALLLGPGMCGMWISTALLVWALVPDIPFIYALAVGSCVTPTDPVLSNSIVKGKFADNNIPKDLQSLIIAESGANDGLGFPFLFIALYLIRYTHDGGLGQEGGAGKAMGYWFGITWGYEIILSTLYGSVVGYIFKEALHWAEKRKYVDRESFLVFAVSLGLFIVGTLGMIGSDDVLACFIAGNVFTWDDWFRQETHDDSFQATIDMLLNVAIFAWYGAVCPWSSFLNNSVIPIYRLIFLGILVLLFRRIPTVWALHSRIHQIQEWRQMFFVGYFGPIGVSAIFYLYTSREYLATIRYDHHQRADAAHLTEVFNVVVWFIVICSIVVHGISVPLGKLGVWLPRTLSRAVSSERSMSRERRGGRLRSGNNISDPILPFRIQRITSDFNDVASEAQNDTHDASSSSGGGGGNGGDEGVGQIQPSRTVNKSQQPPRPLYRIGGTIIKDPKYPVEDGESNDDDGGGGDTDNAAENEDLDAAASGTNDAMAPQIPTVTLDAPDAGTYAGDAAYPNNDVDEENAARRKRLLDAGRAPQSSHSPSRSIRFDSSPERDRGR